MTNALSPLTIGITLFVPKAGLSVWSNGASQNVCHLWALLKVAGHNVILINGGDGDPPKSGSLPPSLHGMQFAKLPDVIDSIDVLIEAGAQVGASAVARVQANGGKAITLKFGHALAIDGERAIHNKPAGAIYNGARFDCVWTTSQLEPQCGAYWELTYRCPVRVLPHVWGPCFVDEAVKGFPAAGLVAGYQPGRVKKRLVSFEPCINLIKTCHIPMLIAEAAWRERQDLIDTVYITNAEHLRDRLAFRTFANALDICHAKSEDGHPVCSFEGRWNTPYFMAAHGDVCVSHQWVAVPNYCHYDLLHLGYPIVHNVHGMPGYFYDGFDAIAGGLALIEAMTEHDGVERQAQYKRHCDRFLGKHLFSALDNIDAHCRAIANLMPAARMAA